RYGSTVHIERKLLGRIEPPAHHVEHTRSLAGWEISGRSLGRRARVVAATAIDAIGSRKRSKSVSIPRVSSIVWRIVRRGLPGQVVGIAQLIQICADAVPRILGGCVHGIAPNEIIDVRR